MIGVGTSLLFDRRAGKAGPPIPPFNEAMVDAWFMSGLSNIDKPSSIKGVMGNEMVLNNFAYSLSSGFGAILLLPIIKLVYIIAKFHGKLKIPIMGVRLR